MKIRQAYPKMPEYSDMLAFRCPACGCDHQVSVGPKSFWNPPNWTFNGDRNNPTINPSVLVTRKMPNGEERCHSFIRDGKIQYLNDCTHEFAGKTIELPNYTENELEEGYD